MLTAAGRWLGGDVTINVGVLESPEALNHSLTFDGSGTRFNYSYEPGERPSCCVLVDQRLDIETLLPFRLVHLRLYPRILYKLGYSIFSQCCGWQVATLIGPDATTTCFSPWYIGTSATSASFFARARDINYGQRGPSRMKLPPSFIRTEFRKMPIAVRYLLSR